MSNDHTVMKNCCI